MKQRISFKDLSDSEEDENLKLAINNSMESFQKEQSNKGVKLNKYLWGNFQINGSIKNESSIDFFDSKNQTQKIFEVSNSIDDEDNLINEIDEKKECEVSNKTKNKEFNINELSEFSRIEKKSTSLNFKKNNNKRFLNPNAPFESVKNDTLYGNSNDSIRLNQNFPSTDVSESINISNQRINDLKTISKIKKNDMSELTDVNSIISDIEKFQIGLNSSSISVMNPLKISKPRDYQEKIFEEIKKCNSIVFMETGKGKTFISIMLIKHKIMLEAKKFKSESFHDKRPFFENKKDCLEDFDYYGEKTNKKMTAKERVLQSIKPNINSYSFNNMNNPGSEIIIKSKQKFVFLVGEVVLLDQQKIVLEQNLDKNINVVVMNCSKKFSRISSTCDSFRAFWNENTIFVSTPSIVYKLLSSGYINISDIDLLIFDECHHTDGNHPYNMIMNEFYFFHKENEVFKLDKLPQILGLTASPLKKKIDKDVNSTGRKALENLSDNLDSVMIIDPEVLEYKSVLCEDDNIKKLSNNEAKREYIEISNPKEHKAFPNVSQFLLNNLYYPLMEICFQEDNFNDKDDDLDELKNAYRVYVEEKTSCAGFSDYNKILSQKKYLYEMSKTRPLFELFEKIQRQIFMLIENLNFDSVKNLMNIYRKKYTNEFYLDEKDKMAFKKNTNKQKELQKNQVGQIKKLFNIFWEKAENTAITYESPRLCILLNHIYDIIKKDINLDKDPRIIVFVSNRVVCEMLSELVNNDLNEKFNSINYRSKNKNNMENINRFNKEYRCVSVVGVNKTKNENSFNPSNSINKMNENVQKFKDGTAQILIGTSTVEEGIDVKSCDHVIVYTALKTAKSYIQMKGRARQANAIFSIYTDDIKKMQETISDFVELILFIRSQFNKNSIVSNFKTSESTKKFLLDEDKMDYYCIEKNKAKVSINNAQVHFNELFQQVKNKDPKAYFKLSCEEKRMPNLNGNPIFYKCKLFFSSNLYGPHDFESDFRNQKKVAEASCFVSLFCKFHLMDLVDDNFKLISKKY